METLPPDKGSLQWIRNRMITSGPNHITFGQQPTTKRLKRSDQVSGTVTKLKLITTVLNSLKNPERLQRRGTLTNGTKRRTQVITPIQTVSVIAMSSRLTWAVCL